MDKYYGLNPALFCPFLNLRVSRSITLRVRASIFNPFLFFSPFLPFKKDSCVHNSAHFTLCCYAAVERLARSTGPNRFMLATGFESRRVSNAHRDLLMRSL